MNATTAHLINNILGRPEWAATTQQDLAAAKAARPDLFNSAPQGAAKPDNRPLWAIVRKGALLGAAQAISTREWALKRQLLALADEAATKSGADALLLAAIMEMGPVPAPDLNNRLIAGVVELAKSATDADLKAALAVIAREKAGQEARQRADRARKQETRAQDAARRQADRARRQAPSSNKISAEEAEKIARDSNATANCPFIGQRVTLWGRAGDGYVADVPGASNQRTMINGERPYARYGDRYTGVVERVYMALKDYRDQDQGYVPVYVITDLTPA